ncbi:MAG: c-type cytochrome [Candidatus Dadabacteria bacterium]|nr:c-type cytochrome [Candidatus Dadabacteria bacterium]
MFGRARLLILTTLIIFISASVKVIGFPWNYDMWKQKSIKPYEMPMSYPKGTVRTDGTTDPEDRQKVEAITLNRLDPAKLDVSTGKELYMTNCAVCHGEKADGNGPVIKKGFYPVNLKVQAVKDRTDGYLFAYIRYGGKVMMPSYRENITEEQAWQVVNYIRHIQKQSN